MPPTFQQTKEQRRATFEAAGVPFPTTQPEPIDVEALQTPPQAPLDIAPAQVAAPISAGGVPEIPSALAEPVTPTEKEVATRTLTERIIGGRAGLIGETAAQVEAERMEDIRAKREEVERIQQRISAIDVQAAEEAIRAEERLAPTFAIRGEQAAIERSRAVQQLGLNAQFQAATGNLELAQDFADRAVAAEFDPIKDQLALDLANLELIQGLPDLTASEKAAADVREAQIKAEQAAIEDDKAAKEQIFSIGLTARQFGATDTEVQAIFDSESSEEALLNAGGSLQDPAAQLALETSRLNNILKREQIKKTQRETELLGEPTAAETKATKAAIKEAKASIPIMEDKIDAINILKEHGGLNQRVGPSAFARKGFAVSEIYSGKGSDFAGGIHKLVSGLALDSLISAKARGATFGALSDKELELLANAATAINDWEIKKDGVGQGVWDIDEVSFKRELDTIKELTQRALTLSRGNLFSGEETAVLDDIYQDQVFDPSLF